MKYNYKYFTKIFEPFGYYVFNRDLHNETSECFDLYIKDSERGIEWFGSFKIFITETGKPAYTVYTPNEWDLYSPERVIEEITEFNKTRILPSYCYNPNVRPFAKIESSFLWYMKTLGFERPKWDEGYSDWAPGNSECWTMVYRNMYGEVISKITCYIDNRDDIEMKGSICRFIGKGWSWVESKYSGIEEMIASINSILEPEILINAANAIKMSESMTNDRSDNIEYNKIDNHFNEFKTNAKNAIKNALTEALNNL